MDWRKFVKSIDELDKALEAKASAPLEEEVRARKLLTK